MRRSVRRIPRNIASNSVSNTPDRTVTINGRQLLQFTILTGNSSASLPVTITSFGSRLTTIATTFQQYRFTSMKLVLHPGNIANVNTSYVLGFFKNSVVITGPTNFNNTYQSQSSRYHDADETVPCQMVLNRSALLDNLRPWFSTLVGSDLIDSQQGVFYVCTGAPTPSNSFTAYVECVFTVQFRGATNTVVQ